MDTQKIKVRLLKHNEKEITTILKIDHDVFDETALNIWSLAPYLRFGKIFGLFADNSLKGFAIFLKSWNNPNLAYLVEIAIERKNQGKGFGSYLLSKSIQNLKKNGIKAIFLHVDPNNSLALQFYYNKFDFKLVTFHKNEFGKEHDRLFLKLLL